MSDDEIITIPRWVFQAYHQLFDIVGDFLNEVMVWEREKGDMLGEWYRAYTMGVTDSDSDPIDSIYESMRKFDKLLLQVFNWGPLTLEELRRIAESLGYERAAGGWFKGDSMLRKTFAKEEGEVISLSKRGIERLYRFSCVDRQGIKLTDMGRRILERIGVEHRPYVNVMESDATDT